MALRTAKKAEIVLARSKRTSEKYPVRTSHLSGSCPSSRGLVPFLHYTDDTHLKACRCLEAEEHERSHPVSDDDKNLAIAVARYLGKFGLESCLQSVFHQYYEQKKIEWALNNVRAERFHYSSKNKDFVCRCDLHQHRNYRRVHNPEIQELCAEFFQLNTTETGCTQEQWRKFDVKSQKSFAAQSNWEADLVETRTSLPRLRKSALEYDSPTGIELIKSREECLQGFHGYRSRRSSSPRKRHATKSSHMAHLSSRSNGVTDIPEDVWRVSRPSVYLGQYETESTMSTPLGSAATPAWHNAGPVRKTQEFRPSRLGLLSNPPSGTRHDHTRQPSSLGVDSGNVHAASSHRVVSSQPEADLAGLEVRPRETLQHPTSRPSKPSTAHIDPIARTVELPCPAKTVELDTASVPLRFLPHNSRTPQELEETSPEYVAELAGKRPLIRSKRHDPTKGHKRADSHI
ncbi:zinc ion binding [Ascochyta rabiei]|uniref:Zinc ion binding n=1 Tax=Didymella rabiei TaxID=5454 RepID=A0A163DZP0_DIDRA|nr:zinc ion binding [Ascochyta rabiei]